MKGWDRTAADHVHQRPHAFLAPGNAGDLRVLAQVNLDAAEHVLAPILVVVARRPGGFAPNINFRHAIHVLQPLRIELIGIEEIPGDHIQVAFPGLGENFLKNVAALVIRRAELVQDGMPEVLGVIIKHRASEKIVVHFPPPVVGERVALQLPPAGAVVPGIGVQPDRVDMGLLAQNVEDGFNAFIHEGNRAHLDGDARLAEFHPRARQRGRRGRLRAGRVAAHGPGGDRGEQLQETPPGKIRCVHDFPSIRWSLKKPAAVGQAVRPRPSAGF